MDTFELIQTLTAVYGPSGREEAAAKAIADLAGPCADEITTDVMGNLIVHKKGDGPKLLFAAHMDTIGLAVTYVEEDGTLRVGKVGGVTPMDILNTPVRFENGVRGAVKLHGSHKEGKPGMDELYLDIGAKNREEAQKLVKPGDMAVYDTRTGRSGTRVISPYLDNRVSCAVLVQALTRIKSSPWDLYFVFTVQEELGLRGAKTAAYGVDPEYAVAVDVTAACDWPGAPKTGSAVLGGGAAVKIMDASVICHPEMVERITSLAREKGIKTQQDVLTRGGTDAGAIHVSRLGVITGGISVPCRYAHTPTAVSDLEDVEACIDTIVALSENQ